MPRSMRTTSLLTPNTFARRYSIGDSSLIEDSGWYRPSNSIGPPALWDDRGVTSQVGETRKTASPTASQAPHFPPRHVQVRGRGGHPHTTGRWGLHAR